MKSYNAHIVLIVAFLLAMMLSPQRCNANLRSTAHAGDEGMKKLVSLYNKLSSEPSHKLYATCVRQFDSRVLSDTTFVGFSVLGDRYDSKDDIDAKERAVVSLVCGGYLANFWYCNYTLAYDMLTKALEIMGDEEHLQQYYPMAYINLGNLFAVCGLHTNSDNLKQMGNDCFRLALDRSAECKNWNFYIRSYLYLTSYMFFQKQNARLKALVDSRYFDPVPPTAPNYKAFKLRYSALKAYFNGHIAEARNFLIEEGKIPVRSAIPARYQVLNMVAIGRTYLQENNPDSAIAVYQSIIPLAANAGFYDVVTNAYKSTATLYKEKGDTKRYMEAYERYVHLNDSLQMTSGLINVGEKHFMSMAQKEAKDLEILKAHNRMIVIGSVCLITVLLVIAVLLFVINIKNKCLEEKNRLLFDNARRVNKQDVAAVKHIAGNGDKEQDDADGQMPAEPQKYKKSTLKDEEKDRLVGKINQAMNDPKVVCQQNLTIDVLAQMLDTNTRYVSQVVNECMGMNFSMVLAKARVREACALLENVDDYGHLTIEGIAQNVGFRSRNSLISAFKRFTGLTPSEYQKMVREKA